MYPRGYRRIVHVTQDGRYFITIDKVRYYDTGKGLNQSWPLYFAVIARRLQGKLHGYVKTYDMRRHIWLNLGKRDA